MLTVGTQAWNYNRILVMNEFEPKLEADQKVHDFLRKTSVVDIDMTTARLSKKSKTKTSKPMNLDLNTNIT